MYTKLSASRSYTYAVARACDAGNVSRQVRDSNETNRQPAQTGAAGRGGVTDTQDCAGSILYSSDRAVEVALDAQQCLVGAFY